MSEYLRRWCGAGMGMLPVRGTIIIAIMKMMFLLFIDDVASERRRLGGSETFPSLQSKAPLLAAQI